MRVTELDYELPEALIAQQPCEERDAARLLVLDRETGAMEHRVVRELPALVRPALWVVNDTRVLAARLIGKRTSGGRVELLLVARASEPGTRERWTAMGRASKPLRAGTVVEIESVLTATVLDRNEDGTLVIELASETPIAHAIERAGHVPLPPYIRRGDREDDRARYQTMFAEHAGAIAAPTAGLHFTPRLVDALSARGHQLARLTLHVGPGTFRPVKVERLEEHPMHAERYEIGEDTARAIEAARREGRPIVAVGTTVVRTLESAVDQDGRVRAGRGETALFVRPEFTFRCVDALVTNFHLPRSTLLALVMAFGGVENVRHAYEAAVRERYRFFSYGDAMLIVDPSVRP